MSRIGKEPISVPSDVQISIQGRNVGVTGPKGSLDLDLPGEIDVREEDGAVLVERPSDDRKNKALHGLTRSCLLYTSPSPRDRQKSRMPSSA